MESNPQKTVNFIGWIIIVLGLTLVFEASSFAFLKIQLSILKSLNFPSINTSKTFLKPNWRDTIPPGRG